MCRWIFGSGLMGVWQHEATRKCKMLFIWFDGTHHMIGLDWIGENPCLVNRKKLLNRQALSFGWLVCSVSVCRYRN